jgi:hypothetical protein
MMNLLPDGEPNPLITLFRQCVVCILDEAGRFRGSGFFVAQGRVATCGHVVHGGGPIPPGHPTSRELLDRTLIWNQAHLRRILSQYETHHNQHRPHRCLHAAAPLKPLPEPVDLEQYRVRRHARAGGLINEYRLIA